MYSIWLSIVLSLNLPAGITNKDEKVNNLVTSAEHGYMDTTIQIKLAYKSTNSWRQLIIFILIFVENCLWYDAIHDLSVWLRTGSNRCHTGIKLWVRFKKNYIFCLWYIYFDTIYLSLSESKSMTIYTNIFFQLNWG